MLEIKDVMLEIKNNFAERNGLGFEYSSHIAYCILFSTGEIFFCIFHT